MGDSLSQSTNLRPGQRGPKEFGSYEEPKPQSGVCVEAISVASLFPPTQTPWIFGGEQVQIKPDEIPPSMTDENCKRLVTKNNRTGGQLIRIHDFPKYRSWVASFFGRVGVTEFLNLVKVTPGMILKPGIKTTPEGRATAPEPVVTPGVNLKVDVTPIEGPAGQASLAVGAAQGSAAKIIGENNPVDLTPRNRFRIVTSFVPPTEENAGVLVVAINRTQFPHLMVRSQLWGPDTKPLADVSISLEATDNSPLSGLSTIEMRPFFYKLEPGTQSRKINIQEAVSIAKKHNEFAASSVNSALARVQVFGNQPYPIEGGYKQ